ncbi:sensor histidine kinase [Lysobacter auxotrophicus]|uniref:histidine kinase n=1 Tax=Lysobacter auxotrophicus TaxID=2992573 RepID=A0ABM8DD06_9GAMM|nr:HWE histidine kinase domain-containing protein [Lysobacter auxotrophicus]BDU16479.1 PAS domain-containing protein [Lysobacter auxotrophicus]
MLIYMNDVAHAYDPEAAASKLRLYEAVLQATPDLVYVFDLQHRFIYANDALLTMWGRSWSESIGKTCLELGYEPWHAQMHDREIEQVIATRLPIRGDVPFPHKTKGVRIYDYIFTPVFGPDGNVEAIAGSTRDVTERQEHEKHMRLLVNELNHRVKNTLAIVQSLVFQTLDGAPDVDEAREKIESRLLALSDAHDILTRENWQGADMVDIVEAAAGLCQQYVGERFDIAGSTVILEPRRAVAMAMALHELCTNAIKHGALSAPTGRVAIHWSFDVDRSAVQLTWKETGGPPVSPPTQRGFGSTLLQRGLKHDLGGDARLTFEPDGLRCDIVIPFETREVAIS